jgi:hypothetical protein
VARDHTSQVTGKELEAALGVGDAPQDPVRDGPECHAAREPQYGLTLGENRAVHMPGADHGLRALLQQRHHHVQGLDRGGEVGIHVADETSARGAHSAPNRRSLA